MAGKGFNGRLTTVGYGSYRIRCTALYQGLNVISNEGEGSTRRAFYPVVTTSSSFGMDIAFPSWEDRERFNKWMSGFMEKISAGRGFRGAMNISVPSRNFTRDAVPSGPVTYGEGLTDVGYSMNLSFVGASDPMEINKSTQEKRAYFRLPKGDRKTAKHYYPMSQTAATGAGDLDGAIFDTVASVADEVAGAIADTFGSTPDNPFNPFA